MGWTFLAREPKQWFASSYIDFYNYTFANDLPTQDIKDWKAFTNDSNLICTGVGAPTMYSYGRNLVKLDTREYYKTELEKLKNLANQGCDILVNHVAQTIPPYYELPPEYRGDPNNKFYYTENFDLIKQSGCEYYIFGHTHDNFDFVKEDVTILCNPVGYPHEKKEKKIKQFEI